MRRARGSRRALRRRALRRKAHGGGGTASARDTQQGFAPKKPRRRAAAAPLLPPTRLGVDGGGDGVVHLAVQLRQHVGCAAERSEISARVRRPGATATRAQATRCWRRRRARRAYSAAVARGRAAGSAGAAGRARTVEDARLLQIADGGRLDDVAHDEALHGLVLGHQRAAGLAEHALDLRGERWRQRRALGLRQGMRAQRSGHARVRASEAACCVRSCGASSAWWRLTTPGGGRVQKNRGASIVVKKLAAER